MLVYNSPVYNFFCEQKVLDSGHRDRARRPDVLDHRVRRDVPRELAEVVDQAGYY